jgi:hypothetical protein
LALFKFNTSKCSLKIIDMLLHCDCTIFFIVHDKALMMMKITFYNNSLASHYNRKHNAFVVILKNHPWQKNHWVCKKAHDFVILCQKVHFFLFISSWRKNYNCCAFVSTFKISSLLISLLASNSLNKWKWNASPSPFLFQPHQHEHRWIHVNISW